MPSGARKLLITGGLGFIGLHLAERLSAEPDAHVTLVDNLVRGRMDAAAEALCARANVTFVQVDLTDPAAYAALGSGYDEVYHFAAIIGVDNVLKRPEQVIRVNTLSVIHLLDWLAAGGGRRVLFSSTSEVYAWTQQFHALPIPTPEDVPLSISDVGDPRASYAGGKILGELAVTHYARAHALPSVIVRYHNVYGPRMGTSHVIPQLYHRAAVERRNPLPVYSVGHARAFCFVDDAVAATVGLMRTQSAEGGTFNIGDDSEEVVMGDLARRILQAAGVEAEIEPRQAASDPIARRCPDISRLRAAIGYAPKVDLDEGLRRTIAWYRDFYAGKTS